MEKYGRGGNTGKEKAFQLEDVARRVEPKVSWEDLALPQVKLSQLKDICNRAREYDQMFGEPGIERSLSHSKGLNVLFSGPPRSGKIMAAEAIASDLRMPLYKIDLMAVVNKYIGETERNLRRVFEAADRSDCVLFFDEADALFGKRTEVKDSHDRYANVDVAYLLQRMESFKGLAILTSNLKSALDEAFVRRLDCVIVFPSLADSQSAD